MSIDARRAVSQIDGMTIKRGPEEMGLGGHSFYRLEYSGVGLHRAMLVTEIRCHLVTFNLTASTSETLDRMVDSVEHISFNAPSDPAWRVPVCIKDFVAEETVLHRVPPRLVGTIGTSIPVRLVLTADGQVRWVHVIRATTEQKRNIEAAFKQWRFKPDMIELRGDAVETGLLVQIK